MKAANAIKLVALMLVVCSVTVGCKRPQHLTPLPGFAPGQTKEGPTGPLDSTPTRPITEGPGTSSAPITPGPEGIAPSDLSGWQNWPQDREAFRNQTVYFDFDRSNVKQSELPKLDTVAGKMKSTYAGKVLLVEGHCDERGTEEYNRALGERRALAVRETLARLGLDPAKIVTISYGEDRPVVPGHNEAAWSKNRRGELVLLTPSGAPVTGGGTP
jgi:peptidoglycan-associated lipoprotein